MKMKEVTVVFEYTNPEVLKQQMDYLYSKLTEGYEYKEEVRTFNGVRCHFQFMQKYKRMRNFKIVNETSIVVKSNV